MRIARQSLRGVGNADEVQEFGGVAHSLAPRALAVKQNGLRDLVADGVHRVERGHRLLKDHSDLIASDRLNFLAIRRDEVTNDAILARQQRLAGDDGPGSRRGELHDREVGEALA